jgi:REP-associated tyrosine transposase
MSKPPRYTLLGILPHVIQRGPNRQPLFLYMDDYRFALACLHETTARRTTALYASGLMTNHVHGLLTPPQSTSLANVLKRWGGVMYPLSTRCTNAPALVGRALQSKPGRR